MQISRDLTRDRGPSVLVVEDDPILCQVYLALLEDAGFRVYEAVDLQQGRRALSKHRPDILLLDLLLPDGNGLELLKEIQQGGWDTATVVVTTESSANTAVRALQAGAVDYIVKPVDEKRLLTTVRNVTGHQQLKRQVDHYRKSSFREEFQGFVGRSIPMQAVYQMIETAAASRANVFIVGESGTGKELCAEAIHQLSERCKGPFISINCAAIPRELLESEIFGHTRGAFTGATDKRLGAAGLADGGSLFFDELCDMEPDLQAKLLRFIQTRRYRPVGADQEVSTDVRFICATNRNPMAEVDSGRFRQDLFYRLYVIPIELPALRDREQDVVQLAHHFLQQYSREEGKHFEDFSSEALEALLAHGWPGNVRELQNRLQQAVILNQGGTLTHSQLGLAAATGGATVAEIDTPLTAIDAPAHCPEHCGIIPLWQEEKRIIERAIELCHGNVVEAARQLGISDSTIYRKRRRWPK